MIHRSTLPTCLLFAGVLCLATVTPTITTAFVVPTSTSTKKSTLAFRPEQQQQQQQCMRNTVGNDQRPSFAVLFSSPEDNNNGGEDEPSASSSSATDNLPAADDILNSPAFLKRKLEVLKADIEKAEESLADAEQRVEVAKEEWGPQLEDLQREYSNIQDRMSNQRQAGDTMAIVAVVKEVLELLDNFDRAYGVIKPSTAEEEAIEAQYKAAYQQILDTFASLGVREVDTVGAEFDYELHQAVMQMPGTDFEEGIVCQEFQKGFVMGRPSEDEDDEEESLTLIRPAMVAVAA